MTVLLGLLQMLGVTTISSHADSEALGEICHRIVDVFFWQLLADSLQDDFQVINRLRLRLEFMVIFQHGAPDTPGSNLKSSGLYAFD